MQLHLFSEKKMKTKIIALLLSILLVLTACGKGNASEDTANQEVSANSEYSTEASSDTKAASEDTSGGSVSEISENKQSETQALPSPETKKAVEGSAKASEGSVITAAPTSPPQVNGNENEKITVTFSVDCRNAINYGILSQGSFAQVLPADGIILSTSAITVKNGENVMSALKKILKENRINFSISSSGYVRMIGGLSEFDCGAYSGWMYKVNGVLPSVSTKSYPLKDGDKVEFVYTCKMGDV